eukprot:Gb_00988 [translate_table: standard]
MATFIGLSFLPPFKPRADFSHGVNFASAGSGLLNSTYENMVRLYEYTSQWANTAIQNMSLNLPKVLPSKCLYAIAIGGNDILSNYVRNATIWDTKHTQESELVIGYKLLTALELGFLKLVNNVHEACCRFCTIVGAKSSSYSTHFQGWVLSSNQMLVAYNAALKQLIIDLNQNLEGATFVITNIYSFVTDMIELGQAYGFSNTMFTCRRAGPFNAGVNFGLKIRAEK